MLDAIQHLLMVFHDLLDLFGRPMMFFGVFISRSFISSLGMFLAMVLDLFAGLMQFLIEFSQFFRTQVEIGCFAGDAHRRRRILRYIILLVVRFYICTNPGMVAGVFCFTGPRFVGYILRLPMGFISRKNVINCFVAEQIHFAQVF